MSDSSREPDLYLILQVQPSAHPNVVQAAYRALARMFHPDQTGNAAARDMVLVNGAYAVLRDANRRKAYDARRAELAHPRPAPMPKPQQAATAPAPSKAAARGTVLPHGRYAGWTLEQLVHHDIGYLRWLARHTSGIRYRAELRKLLADPVATKATKRR